MSAEPRKRRRDEDDEELSPERREAIFAWIEEKTQRWGMTVPAMVMVEATRPLSFIYSQFVHFGAPYVDTFLGGQRAKDVATFMQNPDNIEELIDRLEARARAEAEEAQRRREERKAAKAALRQAKLAAREARRRGKHGS